MTTAEQRKSPPREDVCRSVRFTPEGEHSDGLTFRGYGAIFNSPTRIDSYEGRFDEQVAPGAFRKSIRERMPKFQFDHGHSTFGSLPPGVIENISEDDRGLFVQARMSSSDYWEPLREAIASGAVDGMSFRFSVINDEWRDGNGQVVKPDELERLLYGGDTSRGTLMRTLKEVKVAEVGPVVWPAYADTTASLRSKVIDLGRLFNGDPEQRRLFAEAALRFGADLPAPEGEQAEPQDTPDGAVEHSEENTDEPRSTSPEAGEHPLESTTEPELDRAESARREAAELLFQNAFDEVRLARESTPPMKGVN